MIRTFQCDRPAHTDSRLRQPEFQPLSGSAPRSATIKDQADILPPPGKKLKPASIVSKSIRQWLAEARSYSELGSEWIPTSRYSINIRSGTLTKARAFLDWKTCTVPVAPLVLRTEVLNASQVRGRATAAKGPNSSETTSWSWAAQRLAWVHGRYGMSTSREDADNLFGNLEILFGVNAEDEEKAGESD